MKRITRNAAKCKLCGDVIESRYRNDFVTCECGNLSVDGGLDYIRRGFTNGKDSYEDLNEYDLDLRPSYMCCPGWWKMLDKELKEFYEVDPELSGVQVKEKYGRADVWYSNSTPTRMDLLLMHEEILRRVSGETCELCGRYGKVRNDHGWIQCRCDRCHEADHCECRKIMRQTAAEYEAEIDRVASLLPADIVLSERDAVNLRYGAWYRDELDTIVNRILRERGQSHQ